MRSLMSSNPFQSARESLIALFDETRKKVSTEFHDLKDLSKYVLLILKIHKKMIKFPTEYVHKKITNNLNNFILPLFFYCCNI